MNLEREVMEAANRAPYEAPSKPLIAEERLFMHVVRGAVEDLTSDKPRHRKHAAQWLLSDEDEPLTFVWYCKALRRDPLVVRASVQRLVELRS